MSIRQDWFRLVRNMYGFVSALRSPVAPEERKRLSKTRPVTLSTRSIMDLPLVAEIEIARSRALAYKVKNQLR